MLLTLRSTARSCASTCGSPVAGLPSGDACPVPLAPAVIPVAARPPLAFAVPALLVPAAPPVAPPPALPDWANAATDDNRTVAVAAAMSFEECAMGNLLWRSTRPAETGSVAGTNL